MKLQRMILGGVISAICIGSLAACGSDDADQHSSDAVDLQSAPENVRWESVSGVLTPVESDDGPKHSGAVKAGWAHTPQGAVMAAINTQVAMATADDDTWPEVSRTLLADGAGRDQWAQGRSLMTVAGTVKNPATFEGFRIADYNDEVTTIVLAIDYPSIGLTATPVQVTWQEDWKTVVPTQDQVIDPQRISSIDGFTKFSAD